MRFSLRSLVRFGRSLLAATGNVLAVAVVHAHDPGLSTVQGVWSATGLELTAGFAPADAQQLLPPDARGSGRLSGADFERVKSAFEAAASTLSAAVALAGLYWLVERTISV